MKKALIVACCFLGLGALTLTGGLIASGGQLSQTGKWVKNTYEINESFSNIQVDVSSSEVQIAKATNGVCKVVCEEREKVKHILSVENGSLTVSEKDDRAWYDHVGFFFGEMKITLYLPEKEYESAVISTASGDIEIGGGFTFTDMRLESSSGEIEMSGTVKNALTANTLSGDIDVGQVCVESVNLESTSGDIDLVGAQATSVALESTSGRIELSDVTSNTVKGESSSGRIELKNVLSTGKTEVRTVSGGVGIENCDGGEYFIKTSSGSVRASFRSAKIFSCKTSSGSVDAPHSTEGGVCVVETSSGNIRLSIIG